LHPFVALGILPVFAFSNAGVPVFYISLSTLHPSIILGTSLGLFIGKQLGIFGSSWLAIKLRFAHMPEHAHFMDLYAIAVLCGIGFTISLFIGTLAFGGVNDAYVDSVKIGVLSGSLLSGIGSYLLFFLARPPLRSH
jgi:NhaA family Na+:H+ antiporter